MMGIKRTIVGRGFFARSAQIMPERTAFVPPPPGCAPRPAVVTSAPDMRSGRYEQDLAHHALGAARHAHPADRDAAVDAGLLAQARTHAGDGPVEVGAAVAEETARCADAVTRQGDRVDDQTGVDWAAFGVVIPVLAASPGTGASVVAAAVADAAQVAGLSVLLVDTADPVRSGLNRATASDGPAVGGPHPAVRVRFSWRAQALVARAETTLPILTPGMLPPPRFWRPGPRRIDVTVADVGHDPWRVTAHPLAGAGAWLRPGTPSPRALLVVRPSVPSLTHAEQVLARLQPWVDAGAATSPAQLVVAGAKTWPRGVAGTAGRRLQQLLADAIFLPHDPGLASHGVTAAVTPARLRAPVTVALRRWGIQPGTRTSPPEDAPGPAAPMSSDSRPP